MSYSELTRQEKADLVLSYLKEDYPEVRSPLFHRNAFEFLISVMLSPQTNDETTNKVTPALFEKYPSPEELANAEFEEVLDLIRIINYNKTKTKRIIDASKLLVDQFDSKVPHTMKDMLSLPGVGRKVANVILNDWYATPEDANPPYSSIAANSKLEIRNSNMYNSVERGSIDPTGFVVDTHVIRVSGALGLTEAKSPDKIEKDLIELFAPSEWMGTSLRMIYHGREVFQAKNPEFNNFAKWNEIYSDLGF